MAIVEPREETRIGVSRPRPDSREKVTGLTRFEADRPVIGLLHARLVPSLYAHSRIRGIDASEALALPGVIAVLTAADLPIRHRDDMRMFEPLARSETVFAGQPVAMVIAESESIAEDAVGLVTIDAEPLPPVLDPEAAMAPESPLARLVPLVDHIDLGGDAKQAHAAVGGEGAALDDEPLSDNVAAGKRYADGDLAAAFATSDHVVEGTFTTSWVYQGYLEPHTATAWLDPDGTLRVESSTQGTFYARKQLAKIYGLPLARIRVKGSPLGGAFGSKLLVVDPLVAGAALKLRRPIRLALTRQEDMRGTNPAPGSTIKLRIGARADGTLTGIDARLVFDAGAFTEWTIEGIARRPRRERLPLAGVRHPRVRPPDEPFRDRLVSRARRPAGVHRHRVAHRRARPARRHRPRRVAPPEPRRRGRPHGRRRDLAQDRRRRGPRGRGRAPTVA